LGPDVLIGEPALQRTQVPAAKTRPGSPRERDHAQADAEALAIAGRIAERLTQEPELIEHARRYLAAHRTAASPRHQSTLDEWEEILRTTSVARLQRFLVDQGERATRLRQSLPFLGALSPEERQKVLGETRSDPAPTHMTAQAMNRKPRR
jgi:hypothetical protein